MSSTIGVPESLREKTETFVKTENLSLSVVLPAPSSNLGVKSKIWFVCGHNHFFGSGLACLLEQVDKTGSLQQAVEVEGMSYRYAWGIIKTAEKHLGMKLLVRSQGGKDGGGSSLSPQGKRMLRGFYGIETKVRNYADKEFAKFLQQKQEKG